MDFLGKEYTVEKSENFDAFLRSTGVPEEKIAVITKDKPTQKLTKDGDTFTLTTSSPKGPKDSKFKSGVEFDDVIGEDNTPIKTTITVDGNVVTQTIKSPLGSAIFKREYSANDLIVTITSDKFDGVAKRFYKA